MKLLYVFSLSILLNGCLIVPRKDTHCDGAWHISNQFSPEHKQAIRDGMYEWNTVMGEQHFRENNTTGKCWIKVHQDESTLAEPGIFYPDTSTIYLDINDLQIRNNCLGIELIGCVRQETMHQLGHSMGLGHLKAQQIGIMNPTFGVSDHLTIADHDLLTNVDEL